ncbi:hypothetical protein MPER_05457, partial [Moniliophthora perniciosa FA553]
PCGIPVVSVVFARLLVHGEDRGIKPFIVHLSDGYKMNLNISCKALPPRCCDADTYYNLGGSRLVKHALTYFNQVRLPASALLGTSERERDDFQPSVSLPTLAVVIAYAEKLLSWNAFAETARGLFVKAAGDIYRQHFIAIIFKATMYHFALSIPLVLGDRCGAQGLSEVNQLSVMHADMRGG